MACKDQPVTCRGKIARALGLKPNSRKPWQFDGKCPQCGHGGFSITAGNQGSFPPRHIWHCNCHRCRCDPAAVRAAMVRAGISEDCLGSYGRGRAGPVSPEAQLRSAMESVLADPKIRALADLKLRMAEVLWGEAPADFREFIAFAGRAGVQRSKRYEAASRWGRRTAAVVPDSNE